MHWSRSIAFQMMLPETLSQSLKIFDGSDAKTRVSGRIRLICTECYVDLLWFGVVSQVKPVFCINNHQLFYIFS